jgi:hypothetical protein
MEEGGREEPGRMEEPGRGPSPEQYQQRLRLLPGGGVGEAGEEAILSAAVRYIVQLRRELAGRAGGGAGNQRGG